MRLIKRRLHRKDFKMICFVLYNIFLEGVQGSLVKLLCPYFWEYWKGLIWNRAVRKGQYKKSKNSKVKMIFQLVVQFKYFWWKLTDCKGRKEKFKLIILNFHFYYFPQIMVDFLIVHKDGYKGNGYSMMMTLLDHVLV